ncbi:MAG: DUF5606 domain-containing protein [Saprospiraceae bacterium]|nr:DUF5606 domain-containing protein [Saprospiraceae bacterium]
MVKLEQIVAVSSKDTLFKAIASKSNGLILEDLSNGKNSFFSGRIYQISPLDSMGLYILGGTMPLKEVYEMFISKESEYPVPPESTGEEEMKQFFQNVIPEYDTYKVKYKDMKKCLRWYHQLKEFRLINTEENVSE